MHYSYVASNQFVYNYEQVAIYYLAGNGEVNNAVTLDLNVTLGPASQVSMHAAM